MQQPPEPGYPIPVGLYERASRTVKKGDKFFVFYYGRLIYGEVDGNTRGNEIYLKTEVTDHEINSKQTVWYIVNRKWLLTPADYYSLLN